MGRWAWRRGAAVTPREKAKLISRERKTKARGKCFLDGTKKTKTEKNSERETKRKRKPKQRHS